MPSTRTTERLIWVAIFVAVMSIFFWKADKVYLRPPLFFEDGRELFAYYFEHREPSSILRSYAGYVSLAPNIVGYVGGWLPVRWIPRTYSFCALFANSLACVLFYAKRFRPIVPSDTARATICLFLALMPLGDVAVLTLAMYMLWPLLIVLFLALLVPFGDGGARRVGTFLALSLCICSHPLSVVAGPLMIFNCFRHDDRRERVMNLCLLAVLSGYIVWGTQPKAQIDIATGIKAAIVAMLDRVCLEGLVGAVRRTAWHGAGWPVRNCLLGFAALGGVASLVVALRSRFDRISLQTLLVLGYVMTGLTLASALSRGWNEFTLAPIVPKRYTFVQEFCWLLGLAVILARLGPRFVARRAWRRVAVVAVLLLSARLSFENKVLWSPDELGVLGQETRNFLREVERVQKDPQRWQPIDVALQRDVWTIKVRIR